MAQTSREISSTMSSTANNYNTRLDSSVRIKTRIRTEVTQNRIRANAHNSGNYETRDNARRTDRASVSISCEHCRSSRNNPHCAPRHVIYYGVQTGGKSRIACLRVERHAANCASATQSGEMFIPAASTDTKRRVYFERHGGDVTRVNTALATFGQVLFKLVTIATMPPFVHNLHTISRVHGKFDTRRI